MSGAGHRNMDLILRANGEGKFLFWLRDQPGWLRRARKTLRWKGICLALKNLCPHSLIQLNPFCTSSVCSSGLALSHRSPTQHKNRSVNDWDPLWANTPADSSCMVTASIGQTQLRKEVLFARFCEREQGESLLRIMKKI